MANQQLLDYIKGQSSAGVSEVEIKKILKDAGWPDADVEDAFKASKPAAQTGALEPVFNTSSTTTLSTKPAEQKKETKIFDFTGSAGTSNMSASSTVMNTTKKPEVSSASVSIAKEDKGGASILPWVVAGVAAILFAGVGILYFTSSSSFNGKIASLSADNTGLKSQLSDLKNSGVASSQDAAVLRNQLKVLQAEVGLFATQPGATSAQPANFDLKGTIGFSKSVYSLTTSDGIVLLVKNSKDIKVDTALKPLIGATAELSGAHIPATFEITVLNVNGAPLSETSTSTATTTKTSSGETTTTATSSLR